MCRMLRKKNQEKKSVDTLTKLAENFSETTGFYRMVKWQTWISLIVAVLFLLGGLGIYIHGFVNSSKTGNYLVISSIAGSVVELIAGTAFWLHSKAIAELNEFHKKIKFDREIFDCYYAGRQNRGCKIEGEFL